MRKLDEFYSFDSIEKHKGFYNDDKNYNALSDISYTDFFSPVEDEDFPFDCALWLLLGSCNHFALSLKKVLNYTPYIIENENNPGFHVFCQIYKKGKWYYVDARGITSSFNEFMKIVGEFVHGEFIIRPVTKDDITEWEKDFNYNDEAYMFAEAIIRKYISYYTI